MALKTRHCQAVRCPNVIKLVTTFLFFLKALLIISMNCALRTRTINLQMSKMSGQVVNFPRGKKSVKKATEIKVPKCHH